MTETLADILARAANSAASLWLIESADTEHHLPYRALYEHALRRLAALQAAGARPGDQVILHVKDLYRFLTGFWAAVLGGMVPVPVAVGHTDAHRLKLLRIFALLERPWLFSEHGPLERVLPLASGTEGLPAADALEARLIAAEAEPGQEAGAAHTGARTEDLALIQFSSGSTGDPKGVMLTHRNLLTNLAAILRCAGFGSRDSMLGWMPLTHDMGLIGFHLTPVAARIDHWIMPTDLFVRRPTLWLDKAGEHRVTMTCSPNFALRHYLNAAQRHGHRPPPLDALRLIFNGAEPISVPLVREFLEYLVPARLDPRAMYPVYGLAEATLAVSFPEPGSGLQALGLARSGLGVGDAAVETPPGAAVQELACLGDPVDHCEVGIFDDQGERLPTGRVGRIWIRGGNVTQGYYRNPAATAEVLHEDGWLDTGDLGFLGPCGLVVTGRAKEIIFAHGQNFYPQDLEALIERETPVRPGRVAVAADRAESAEDDTLLVFLVHKGPVEEIADLAREIHGKLVAHTGLEDVHVIPVPRIPKTTSGKVQRLALVHQYREGAFTAVDHAVESAVMRPDPQATGEAGIQGRLLDICAQVMPRRVVGPDDNLFEIGTSSLELARIHEAIETAFPGLVEVTDLFDHPTVRDLARLLNERLSRR